MYASIRYIQTHHDYSPIPSQPDQNPFSRTNQTASVPPSAALPPDSAGIIGANGTTTTAAAAETATIPQAPQQQQQTHNTQGSSGTGAVEDMTANGQQQQQQRPPDPPHVFDAALKELAQDLVVKEQQIEYLIEVLPGIGRSEEEQGRRIRELEEQLQEVEGRRREAVRVKEECIERLDGVIGRVRRI